MSMFGSNIDYTKLIQFSGGSVRVATFVEIRDALTKRFKEIYGNDIDVSTASADGQYINEISLVLNNILQSVQFAFDSLDPAVATGKYLDVICSYNNIQRIAQSPSVVELYVYNSNTSGEIDVDKLLFIDRGGQTWLWENTKDLNGNNITKFPHGEAVPITGVQCEISGAIQAPGSRFIDVDGNFTDDISQNDWSRECPGWVYQLTEASPLRIWQREDAVIGNDDETDESLRSRRYQMLGNKSVSVLEGLQGSLLNISGIIDVYIFNNMEDEIVSLDPATAAPIADGTDVLGHSIYVTIRVKEGVSIEDSTIGKLIYNKLTPGIGTTPALYEEGSDIPSGPGCKSYRIQRTDNISYTIYWKQAQPNNPTVALTFSYNDSFDFPTSSGSIISASHDPISDAEKAMAEKLVKAMSDVKISSYAQPSMLMTAVQQTDRQKLGVATFFVTGCTIGGSSNNYPANLRYFKYTTCKFAYNTVSKVGTMTLS